MKAVFVVYNQALTEKVDEALKHTSIKGYTKWMDMAGAGTQGGEPHLGTHTWPALNSGILTIVEDEKVQPLLEEIKAIEAAASAQGIHAFVWNIEQIL